MNSILPRTSFTVLLLTATAWAQTEWVRWEGSLEPRAGYAMAYDPIRDRVVLFGGDGEFPGRGDTWEWAGTDWRRLTPAQTPRPRVGAAMAFDAASGEVLLFGGTVPKPSGFAQPQFEVVNDTWSLDGTRWTQRLPPHSPPARAGHAMTLDEQRGRIVLYGGAKQNPWFTLVPAETWEWDGVRWSVTASGPQPPPAMGSAMAFNRLSGRVVLFGGDTIWEWDGSQWWNHTPAIRPPARFNAALGFDPTSGTVILFGGVGAYPKQFADTWSWNGASWTRLQPTSSPPAAGLHRLVDRGNRGRPFLHGVDSSWEWDGSNWIRRWRADAPTRQEEAGSMAYDPSRALGVLFSKGETRLWWAERWLRANPITNLGARGGQALAYDGSEVILFGGGNGGLSLPTTWAWNGSDWQSRATTGPAARLYHAMAYDEARGRVVLFGGAPSVSNFNAVLGDTWEWDGARWTQRFVTPAPVARRLHAMVFDPGTRRVMLFGGADTNKGPLGDWWAYDGSRWVQLQPATVPPPRWGHTLTYDELRRRVVLCAGAGHTVGNANSGSVLDDTWEWDGTRWWQRSTATELPHRHSHAAIYDPLARATVVFGGWTTGIWGNYLGDTWLYRPTHSAAYDAFGTACASSAGVPSLRPRGPSLPWIGETLTVDVSGLPPGSPASLITGVSRTRSVLGALPLRLDPLGMPGCTLLASLELIAAMTNANASGVATASMPTPYVPNLLGVEVYQQAIALDPTANPAGAVMSNGAVVRLGGL